MYYSNNDDSTGKLVLEIIGLVLLIIFISACSRACSRSSSDMIYIQSGYCYDENTKIIYKEIIVGRYDSDTTYTIYYDENGNICKYNDVTGEWDEVDD
jgi:hypothetical protein